MPRERFHYRGKYVIRCEWRGNTLLYDVATRGGLIVAMGLDMMSLNEETAVEGIVSRLYGKGQEKAA